MESLDAKQFVLIIRQIAEEKNLPFEVVQDALEHALAAAYRKDYGTREQDVQASINPKTGNFKIFIVKEVVKVVEDPDRQMTPAEAKQIDPKAKVGTAVQIPAKVKDFGRVAAQTAKQVILQKLREAEREVIYDEYSQQVGALLNGTVQRIEPRVVYIDLGKTQGILPGSEQIPREQYHNGQRLRVFLRDVETSARGPQLVLSRAVPEFISLLFAQEVPEMENEAVEIKAIAREPGTRTKIAVASTVPGVDPVGTFVGGHGTRVQAVMNEVGEEKIDIIAYQDDPKTFITNALSPTRITKVELKEADHTAEVTVPDDQLSIAIGKSGQNVRLASKLTGWQIDIKGEGGESAAVEEVKDKAKAKASNLPAGRQGKPASKQDLEAALIESVDKSEVATGGSESAADIAPGESKDTTDSKATKPGTK